MDVQSNVATKIMLSAKELDVVSNIDWLLTKHKIIAKVLQHFAVVSQQMLSSVAANANSLPAIVALHPPKIAKGENYVQLPYVMLDYPRFFLKNEALAIRTFFWWGNHISMHLLLNGSFKIQYQTKVIALIPFLQQHQFYICVHQTEWQHHFKNDNYMPMQNADIDLLASIIINKQFIKLAKKIPLQQWENFNDFFDTTFKQMLNILST